MLRFRAGGSAGTSELFPNGLAQVATNTPEFTNVPVIFSVSETKHKYLHTVLKPPRLISTRDPGV